MHQDDLTTLTAWVRQESPTSDPAGVNRMVDLVGAKAESFGLATERMSGPDGLGDMLLVRSGPQNAREPIIMLGHLDTVHPRGSIDTAMPVRHDGDRLYGPGSYDMKAGVLIALRGLLGAMERTELSRPVLLILSPDEEIGSPFGGSVIRDLARQARCALVFEPARAGGGCITSRKGVSRLEVEIHGVAAHSGMQHENGRSAIVEAAHQILAIEALTDYDRGVTASVGLIGGGTTVNTVPAFCRLSVDLRAITVEDAEASVAAVHALSPVGDDVRLTVTGGLIRPPFERTPANLDLLSVAQDIAATHGITLPEAPRTGGGSDGNITAAMGIPTLDALGAEGSGAHTSGEFALISSVASRQSLVADLLHAL